MFSTLPRPYSTLTHCFNCTCAYPTVHLMQLYSIASLESDTRISRRPFILFHLFNQRKKSLLNIVRPTSGCRSIFLKSTICTLHRHAIQIDEDGGLSGVNEYIYASSQFSSHVFLALLSTPIWAIFAHVQNEHTHQTLSIACETHWSYDKHFIDCHLCVAFLWEEKNIDDVEVDEFRIVDRYCSFFTPDGCLLLKV